MKLTFKPTEKYKGERTGLVVMGLDYAGLILENTDKGLVLSQVSCPKADKGTSETVNGTVDLRIIRFTCVPSSPLTEKRFPRAKADTTCW